MHRLVIVTLLATYGTVADEPIKEEVAAGYYSPAQSAPSYGYDQPSYQQPQYNPPAYQQPSYQPPPPYYQPQLMLPPFALPTFDVSYCSVHASFPLVGVRRHHRDHHHHHHHPFGPRMRKFERQSCRYTAVFSWKACNTCCNIASRTNANLPMKGITGALMVFDPHMDFHRHGDHPEQSHNKILQCVCCAPKIL